MFVLFQEQILNVSFFHSFVVVFFLTVDIGECNNFGATGLNVFNKPKQTTNDLKF